LGAPAAACFTLFTLLAPFGGASGGTAPAFARRSWSDEILYFVLIDRFADGDSGNDIKVDRSAKGAFHGGDIKGLTEHLDEIAGLGVTAIWLNPILKNIDGFVTGAGFPDWAYHGYWTDDLTRIDPRFGTEREVKDFVEACHRRGIRVLLDVVYNHVGYGSHYVTDPRTRDWLRTSERGTCGEDDVTTCVSGLPDWKTENRAVADFLLDAQLGWAKRLGVDGFRLDTVKHVDHLFWDEHRARARSLLGPSFFLLGEVWGGDAESLDPWFSTDEMDAGFDFSFQGSVVAFLLGRGRPIAFDRYLKSREKVRVGHLLAHFLSSHDVPGALSLLGGDTGLFRLAAVLQMTCAGIPTIYYGEEVGRRGGDWPENRSDMPWGARAIRPGAGVARDESLREDYRKLIAIRRAHPALSRGVHSAISTEGDLYAFLQEAGDDAVLVAINRGRNTARFRISRPAAWGNRSPEDLFGSGTVENKGPELDIEVPGHGSRILGLR
jgi:alpha-amylase